MANHIGTNSDKIYIFQIKYTHHLNIISNMSWLTSTSSRLIMVYLLPNLLESKLCRLMKVFPNIEQFSKMPIWYTKNKPESESSSRWAKIFGS